MSVSPALSRAPASDRLKRSATRKVLTLRVLAGQGIHYRSLYPPTPPHTAYAADLTSDTTLPLLKSYFQLDTPLAPLYAEWSAKDAHIKRKLETEGERLQGIRVLNQDPWECLISWVCSVLGL